MQKRTVIACCFAAALTRSPSLLAQDPNIQYLRSDPTTGSSLAVVVEDAPLAHTTQLWPADASGIIVARDDVRRQTDVALENLAAALRAAGTDLGRLVKLNVYTANDSAAQEVSMHLAGRFNGRVRPAVTYVTGELARAAALVALDAIAALPGGDHDHVDHHRSSSLPAGLPADVSVLPRGGVVYIAGQAERGENLLDSTRKTMENLLRTLKFMRLDASHVVQVKSFMSPMSRADAVEREIATFFPNERVPANVLVEWRSVTAIEIELIAYAPPETLGGTNEAVRFFTPPGMTASSRFSRLARVDGKKRIYTSGLFGLETRRTVGQIPEIFLTLRSVLGEAGSDFDHMAKATYYVSAEDVSRGLNTFRLTVYNPSRPPAASKATVRGVGDAEKTITIDMIAVAP